MHHYNKHPGGACSSARRISAPLLFALACTFSASPAWAAEPTAAQPNASAPGLVATAEADAAFVIERDERIDVALKRWAEKSNWTLHWLHTLSWECPKRVEFKGDVVSVVTQVILALNQDGKRLRLRVYDGGQYMEVVSDAAE